MVYVDLSPEFRSLCMGGILMYFQPMLAPLMLAGMLFIAKLCLLGIIKGL